MEIQFPPEITGSEDFKAGPGDVAMVTFKVKAFPGAEAVWSKIIPGETEEDEVTEIKIDPTTEEFKR